MSLPRQAERPCLVPSRQRNQLRWGGGGGGAELTWSKLRTLNRGQNASGLKLLSNLLLLYLWVASIVHLLHRLLRSTRSQLAWRTQLKRSEVLRIPFTRHTSHWLVTLMQLLPNGAQLINTTVPVGLSKIPFYAWDFTSLLISQPIYILMEVLALCWTYFLSPLTRWSLTFYHCHHSESRTISPCFATWISGRTHHLKQPT